MAEPAYLSFYLASDTVYIFCGVPRKMGQPSYTRFLINPDTMQLVVQPYHKKEFSSFRVPKALYKPLSGKQVSFRVRSRAFCQMLAAKMKWDVDKSYRVPGTVYPEHSIARFDLAEAKEINAKC